MRDSARTRLRPQTGIATVLAVLATALTIVAGPSPLNPPAEAAAKRRILITGDSITQGSSGDYTWRYRLWTKLAKTAPGRVRFVGGRTGLYDNVHERLGSQHYAAPFSAKAHQALWGDSFADEVGAIRGQVRATDPDILVVMLGSNDLSYLTSPAQTINRARTYLKRARAAHPGLDVVIGEVPDRFDQWSGQRTLTAEAAAYARLLRPLAGELNTPRQRVVVAATRKGWSAKTMTWDGTHPNPTGEALIAQRVSEALAKLGVGKAAPNIAGPVAWRVPGPKPALDPGSEQMDLDWNRTASGATGMFIEQRLVNTGEPWKRLPYAVGGDGWTAQLLAAGGTYRYRLVPSKGTSTGVAGTASESVAGGPRPGAIGSVRVKPGGASDLGGVTAAATWEASAHAQGYLLSYRERHDAPTSWTNLPYPVTKRAWTFEPLAVGRQYATRIRGARGYLRGSWRHGPVTRMRGLPDGRAYAALGDSYSSGLGASGPATDKACSRMVGAWSSQMQPRHQHSGRNFACAGDTISGVRAQMRAMDAYFATRKGMPQLITLTVGGNDVGFVPTLEDCITGGCTDQEAVVRARIDALAGKLGALYRDLRAAHPWADILVGGYPWVVEPGGPSGNVLCARIHEDERRMVTRLVDHLNDVITQAASSAGVWSVGQTVRDAFVGHNACADEYGEDIHAGNLDVGGEYGVIDKKTFHPKDGGQYRYAQAFSDVLSQKATR